jgi:hypothetical protein
MAATLSSSFGQIVLVPLKIVKSISWQLLTGLIFSVLLVACGGSSTGNSSTSSPSSGAGNGSTPGNTLTIYCNALKNRDYQTAYNQYSNEIKNQISEDYVARVASNVSNCSVSNVQQNGSSATGQITYTLANGGQPFTDNYTLMNEDGVWKISREASSGLVSTPTLQAFTSQTWKGQATSSSGDTFDMTLIIDTVTGDTFTGKLVTGVVDTPTYREDTIMNGKITGNRITFSTPTQVMSILDNYEATISNGQMTGSWTTQDQPPLTGTFTLQKAA